MARQCSDLGHRFNKIIHKRQDSWPRMSSSQYCLGLPEVYRIVQQCQKHVKLFNGLRTETLKKWAVLGHPFTKQRLAALAGAIHNTDAFLGSAAEYLGVLGLGMASDERGPPQSLGLDGPRWIDAKKNALQTPCLKCCPVTHIKGPMMVDIFGQYLLGHSFFRTFILESWYVKTNNKNFTHLFKST